MTQLLQQARAGWTAYMDNGKLTTLLLAVLLYLWFGGKGKRQAVLLAYTTVMAACCILPVTAALLMLYQTGFYGYEWVWSMVPLTAVTAYGLTVFISEYWKDFGTKEWKRGVPVVLLIFAVILLSGSLGGQVWNRNQQNAQREEACLVLEQLAENCPDVKVCLWAPQEILEYAREIAAECRLLYGRNMWDSALSAYAYDVYDERTVSLYRWMEALGESQEAEHLAGLEACVESAVELGADCILIPGNVLPETVEHMEKVLGVKAQRIAGYLAFLHFGQA